MDIMDLIKINELLKESTPVPYDEEKEKRYNKTLAELNKRNELSKIRTAEQLKKIYIF